MEGGSPTSSLLEKNSTSLDSYAKNSLNFQVEKYRNSFFLAFFFLGVFNNNGYVLVQAGSSSLADTFDKKDFMGIFQFAMTTFSFLTRYVNGTLLVNIRHMKRFTMVVILAIIAFLLISLASFKGDNKEESFFYVAIFASILIGISSSMGEATFLGYCNGFPSHVVGFVSSGTGCAGLTGTGTLLLL